MDVGNSARANDDWLRELRLPSPESNSVLEDLRLILFRGLKFALSKYSSISEAHIEDFVQDSILKITDKLDTFQGKSKFTTWATKVAVHHALSQMRRKHWQDASYDELVERSEFRPDRFLADRNNPERIANQEQILKVLHNIIYQDLTEKQRESVLLEYFHGLPKEAILSKMDMNRNAFYKLIHDARKKIKNGLEEAGITAEMVAGNFDL